jgi:hypothetical protein
MEACSTEDRGATSLRAALPWLGLALLLAVQYGLFRQYAQREVTWMYPYGYDQAVYLGRSYVIYEGILQKGLVDGVWTPLQSPLPNGLIFETEASLLYLVLGPSRLTALTLNFLHFALFQVALATTLRWYTRRWSAAFLGLGLLLAAGTPFSVNAGMQDFRLDFAAFCLYGVFLCAVIRSGVFLSRRGSVVVGAVGAALVLTRFITAVHLAGVFAGCLGLLVLLRVLVRHDPARRIDAGRRLGGLVLAGLTLGMLAGPVIWWLRKPILGYYLGQFNTGESEIRGEEFGARGRLGRLVFYFESVAYDHGGTTLLVLAALVLTVGLAVIVGRRLLRPGGGVPAATLPAPRLVLSLAGLSLLVPLTVLTLFNSPSPCVGNVMVGPLVLLVVLAVVGLLATGTRSAGVTAVLAALVLTGGGYNQFNRFTRSLFPYRGSRTETEAVGTLYDQIGDCCQHHGWSEPRVAFASVSDFLLPSLITSMIHERQGALLQPVGLLGSQINEISEEQAVEAIRKSNIVVLPLCDDYVRDQYPFVKCMNAYRAHLLEVCGESHVEVGRYKLPQMEVVLLVHPIDLQGTSGGWMTAAGVTLKVEKGCLKTRRHIELHGPHFAPCYRGKTPSVRAELLVPGRAPRPVPTQIHFGKDSYRINLDVSPEEVPDGAVQIRLTFDHYFIPSERPDLFGDTPDDRHLVLMAPDRIALRGSRKDERKANAWRAQN